MATISAGTFVLNPLTLDYPIIQWIENVKEFCNEVIVVDMGSDDGIGQVIKDRFGNTVKVVPFEWKFTKDCHEGKPRNEIVKHAQHDWIYLTDCDEILHERYYTTFHQLLDSRQDIDIYRLQVTRFYGSCYLEYIDPGFQRPIFRNRKGMYFGPPGGKATYCSHTLLIKSGNKEKPARQCVKSKVPSNVRLFDYGKCRNGKGIALAHNFFIKQAMARTGAEGELFDENTFRLEEPKVDGIKYIKWTGIHPKVMQKWVKKHWKIHGWEV